MIAMTRADHGVGSSLRTQLLQLGLQIQIEVPGFHFSRSQRVACPVHDIGKARLAVGADRPVALSAGVWIIHEPRPRIDSVVQGRSLPLAKERCAALRSDQ